MFKQIHHVAIIASNYEISKEFYTQTLGLEIISETYRQDRKSWKLDLQVGTLQIEMFSFPNPPARVNNPEACGLRHLAFAVKDVHRVKKELEFRKVLVEDIRIDEITGREYTFFKDPDGLPLEIYEQ